MRYLLVILVLFILHVQGGSQAKRDNRPPTIHRNYETKNVKAGIPIEVPLHFSYNFTNYGVADGLSQTSVYCVFVDSREIVWIGTYGGGLLKFDGESFTTYDKKDGLADNIIWEILEDENGNLLMASDKGLLKYDGKEFYHLLNTPGMGYGVIRSFCKSADGNLWIGTSEQGVIKYDYHSESIIDHLQPQSMIQKDNAFIWKLCEDDQGNLWMSVNREGLLKYDGSSYTLYTEKDGLGHWLVRGLLCDNHGVLWAATGIGVSRFNGSGFQNFTVEDGLVENWTQSIFQSSTGDIYFGSHEDGVTVYNKEKGFYKTLTTKEGMPGNLISSICEDQDGNIWFGTATNGIAKYEGESFRHLFLDKGNKDFFVTSIFEDNNGVYWYGSTDGLFSYDGKKILKYTTDQGLSHNRINDIEQDKNGSLWIGTEQGLNYFDGNVFHQYFKNDKKGFYNETINGVEIDRNGIVWLSTEWGLGAIKGDTLAWFFEPQNLTYYLTKTVFVDSKDNVWVGTYGGGVSIRTSDKSWSDRKKWLFGV